MISAAASLDETIRRHVYSTLADTGRAPALADLSAVAGSAEDAVAALRRLDEQHALVLEPGGIAVRMALPFSAVPTGFTVTSDDRAWWANCAWDSLAIPVTLGIDADIEATWWDDGGPVELTIRSGEPSHTDGFIHFTVPARHWWDDIVFT